MPPIRPIVRKIVNSRPVPGRTALKPVRQTVFKPAPFKPAPTVSQQQRKLVVIEEGTLASMAINPAIVAEFPVLAPIAKLAAKPKGGCGGCGRANQERAVTFQKVKQALVNMDAERKRKLKDMINAKSARIFYRDSAGRQQQLTF